MGGGLVGFPDPTRSVDSYPFELSGGLRQRAMSSAGWQTSAIALDVTIQAQILKLLRDLQDRFHMAVLMITHDLGVVANLADEVIVGGGFSPKGAHNISEALALGK